MYMKKKIKKKKGMYKLLKFFVIGYVKNKK